MKSIIVTGASSMLGAALIEESIKHGVNIYALVRKSSRNIKRIPQSDLVHVIECDLSDLSKLEHKDFSGILPECEVFYHFGWKATNKEGRNSPSAQAENILTSIEAVRLAKKLHCRKFIGAGSQAEYGIHKEPFTSPETCTEPVTAYGISKLAAGKLCCIEASRQEINFAWVRIFSVYGKNDSPESMIITTLDKLMKNEHCSLTQGIQKWDYLYCDDAARAFYMLGELEDISSKFYCLGSGQARTIRSFIEDMKEVTGSKSGLGFGEIPYVNNIPPSMCADISSLVSDTGFAPSVSFKEGINLILKTTYCGGGL